MVDLSAIYLIIDNFPFVMKVVAHCGYVIIAELMFVSQYTFLACTFCFPISDHVMFSWEFCFSFFTSYANMYTSIRRHLKETIL